MGSHASAYLQAPATFTVATDLATAGKAADADLLDRHDASSFTGGLTAVRGGFEVDLSTTATTVSTLALPVSATHSTFFVFFTAQVATSGGPIRL